MPEDLGKRFDVKLRSLHRTDGKRVPHFMKPHLRKPVPFQESGKELPIGSRFRRLALPREEIVVSVLRQKLGERDGQQRRNRNCALRGCGLGRADVQTGLLALCIVDALKRLANGERLRRKIDILHLESAKFPYAQAREKRKEDAGRSTVHGEVESLNEFSLLILRERRHLPNGVLLGILDK